MRKIKDKATLLREHAERAAVERKFAMRHETKLRPVNQVKVTGRALADQHKKENCE